MSLSLYEITVPQYLRQLEAVKAFLEKSADHQTQSGAPKDALVALQLAEDMLPMSFQIRSVYHHSFAAIKGVQAGEFTPPPSIELPDFPSLISHIDEAIEGLKAFTEEEVNALEGKDLVFRMAKFEQPFIAEDFFLSFSLPNFYFHCTTAYGLLRREGAPLGKRNFLTPVRD